MNYTINISLPKQLAEAAKAQVKAGHFTSVSEVVRTAMRNLLQPDVPTFKMSKKTEKLVEKAMKEYKAGKLKPISSLQDLE